MSYETILYEEDQSVATITFNRPESLNAFNNQMIAETISAVKAAGRDDAVRCVVMTGSGRAFSSGQDLKAVQSREKEFSIGDHLRQGFNKVVKGIVSLEKPVIGAINGVAAGAGFGIALATDLRIASHTASFILAFGRIGLVPDSGASWTLPRLIGYARAYEMAVTGEKVTADKALEWGLINQIVPAEQLPEVVSAWALSLASGPTMAYGLTKRAMYRGATSSLDDALAYEAYLQEITGRSDDFKEGVLAFVEKREARFKGN
ncbi:MAG: enoyl-CoA hydratase/isomerase family protein [Chloroflexota bacterium]|nr:MAG: enoyl-CoA hydratase/isomerase family protein [Chloroflexota bacterium]